MNNRRNEYEATIAMPTMLEEDKISKLKEHWQNVWDKILAKKTLIDQALGNLNKLVSPSSPVHCFWDILLTMGHGVTTPNSQVMGL